MQSMNDVLNELEQAHIVGYTISFYKYEEMVKLAGDIIITESKTNPDVIDKPGHINDSRMGTLSLTDTCQTCSGQNCPGHLGLIKFGKGNEIINPIVIRTVLKVLNCVCHSCSRVLFCNEVSKTGTMSDELKPILKLPPNQESRLTQLEKYCQKLKKQIRKCPCEYGSCVKKCEPLIDLKASAINQNDGTIQYRISDIIREEKKKGKPTKEDETVKTLYMSQILLILKNISHEDAQYLGFIGDTKPIDLIMQGIFVTPPSTRSPITDKNGEMVQNPITGLFVEVIKAVNNTGNAPGKIYRAVRNLILKNDTNRRGGQEVKSYSELMQGKKGIYRFAMMGKRVDWCARTVAGPGEHLRFGQQVLPEEWSTILSKPRKVTHFNVDYYQQLLDTGKINHIIDNKGVRRPPTQGEKLMVGQEVARQLQDKDRIFGNRQPSLSKYSMQGTEIKFEPGNTTKSHLSMTTAQNLDHDGDELNVWFPQDYEVEAEIEYILNAKYCIISTTTGKAAMGLVMNSVTALNLLSQSEITESLYFSLLGEITNKEGLVNLNERLQQFGFKLFRTDVNGERWYHGRAVISALFPPTFEYRNKNVVIYNGILVSGLLTKSQVGPGGRSIVQEIIKHYSIDRGCDFLTDAPFISGLYISQRGFTVGYKDCLNMILDSKAELMNKKYHKQAIAFDPLVKQLTTIVFSPRSLATLDDVTKRVESMTTLFTQQSQDAAFNKQLQQQLKQLMNINVLPQNVAILKQCSVTQSGLQSNTIGTVFQTFFNLKKQERQLLVQNKSTFEDVLARLILNQVVSDPFVLQLQQARQWFEIQHLAVGENPETWLNTIHLPSRIADGSDLMKQVIFRIFDILKTKSSQPIGYDITDIKQNDVVLNKDATAAALGIKTTFTQLENTLKQYQHDKLFNLSTYTTLFGFYKQLSNIVVNDEVKQIIDIFLASVEDGILQPLMAIQPPKETIIENDATLDELANTLPQQVENYTKAQREFVNIIFDLLQQCQFVNFNQAVIGIFNEQLLLLLTTVTKKLKNILRSEYNRNYVTKKEEMAKLMVDVEAMGNSIGLVGQEAQFKEIQVMEKLNIAQSIGTKLAKEVPPSNAILLQTSEGAGTKGSAANVGQIMGAVGQQNLLGERLWNTKTRLSSHFDENDEHPAARGFVQSSFLEGLTPSEMFFVQAVGQESVVSSQLNVPLIGKLERFLQRALENVTVAYDGSVRNSQGMIYSLSYNNGFSVAKTLSTPTLENPNLASFADVALLMDYENHARGWYSFSELKKTNLKVKRTVSLEALFTDSLEETITVTPVAIKSSNKNPEMKLTYYEKARIIGTRATQLNNNAIPRVDIGDVVEPMEIAKMEYNAGVLANEPALYVVRTMPNGQKVNVYPTLDNIV